jgi:hypothetical protein
MASVIVLRTRLKASVTGWNRSLFSGIAFDEVMGISFFAGENTKDEGRHESGTIVRRSSGNPLRGIFEEF